MKITDILENQENTNPLYVANRDFELVPDSNYKGYVMGDNSDDDDDGFVKLGFAVYKFAKTTEYSTGSNKHQQKHYQYVRDIVDPRTGKSPSPYGRLGTFTDKDLDLFRITDVTQREQKLGKKISYEDMYRYTVDALEDGRLKPHIIPRVNETLERGVTAAQLADRFGADVAQDMAKQKGNSVLFTKDLDGRNWKIIKHSDGTIRVERDYMLEGDVIMFEGNGKALVGTIVKMDDDTLVIEGGTFSLNEEEIAEGVGKWIGAAALAGLLGIGANQMLDPGAAERTPLGRAMADAAAKGDTYAAKELKNLGLYMDVGAYDQLAGLKDTYLDVPAGQKYKVDEDEHNFTINDVKQLERLADINDVKRQAIALITTPSKRPISSEKQTWLKNEIMGKKDKMAIIKMMYDLMLGGEGMKVIGSKSSYRRKFDEDAVDEAKYHGREVKLGKPMAGDVKKYKVYVKDPKTGNIKKVNFGDRGMEIKRDDPKRRKNFRARHGCGTPRASNRTKAAYWSCRMWSKKPVGQILKGK